jgi:hypothetical protein
LSFDDEKRKRSRAHAEALLVSSLGRGNGSVGKLVKLPHYGIMYVLAACNISACSGGIITEDSEGSRRHAAAGSGLKSSAVGWSIDSNRRRRSRNIDDVSDFGPACYNR